MSELGNESLTVKIGV